MEPEGSQPCSQGPPLVSILSQIYLRLESPALANLAASQ
jgi:hypothetical protein